MGDQDSQEVGKLLSQPNFLNLNPKYYLNLTIVFQILHHLELETRPQQDEVEIGGQDSEHSLVSPEPGAYLLGCWHSCATT